MALFICRIQVKDMICFTGNGTGAGIFLPEAILSKNSETSICRNRAGIGTEDFSYQFAVDYLKYCKEKGVEIHYEEMPGGHEWKVWDEMIQRFLAWTVG